MSEFYQVDQYIDEQTPPGYEPYARDKIKHEMGFHLVELLENARTPLVVRLEWASHEVHDDYWKNGKKLVLRIEVKAVQTMEWREVKMPPLDYNVKAYLDGKTFGAKLRGFWKGLKEGARG
jgi:hypothetical protein